MAMSADKDDRNEDAKDTAADDAEASDEKKAAEDKAKEDESKASAAKEDESKASDDDEDDEDEDEDEDEDDEAKPAAKPAATSPAKSAAAAKPAARPAAAKSAPATAKRGVGQPGRGKPVPRQRGGSLGKTMILFVVIIGGLGAAFAMLGREDTSPPKWNVGQTLDLDVTLVPSDARNLACATPEEIAGRHCAFEAAGKPWSKGDSTDDKMVLRPYTTTNNIQLFAAGLWSDPGMGAAALPKDDARFTARCKYKVEGSIKKAQVRWKANDAWYDWNDVRYTGTLSDCKVSL
jgi:hypothetical protein